MAKSGSRTTETSRWRQRLEEERKQAREEERRQQALEQRRQEERDREREEQRRQEALSQAQEFEAALELATQRRAELLAQVRAARLVDQRVTRRTVERAAARRAEHRTEQRVEQRTQERAAQRMTQQRADAQAEQRAAAQTEQRKEQRRAEAEDERRGEAQTTQQAAQRTVERRSAERVGQRRAEAHAEQRAATNTQQRAATVAGQRAEKRRAEAQGQQRADAAAADRAEHRRQNAREAARDSARQTARDAARKNARQSALQTAHRDERKRRQPPPDRQRAERPQAERPRPVRDPLQDRIPAGVLSGSLPWLRVNGKFIATVSGAPLALSGVGMLGLESAPPDPLAGFAAGAGIDEETIEAALGWGARIIRLAINRGRCLQGDGSWSAWDYLSDLDRLINRAASGGAYTLLSLRQLDESSVFGTLPGPDGQPTPNFVAPQPDQDTIGLWRLLGERYAEEPAVLFDLYAAPHAALADDLTGFDTDWDLWTAWVRMMVAELRRMHPRALCFISGLDWGTDLRGFPISGTDSKPIPNLVYSAHLAPQKSASWAGMRALARRHPVFATEVGVHAAQPTWIEWTTMSLRAAGIGWAAADWGDMVQHTDGSFAPTRAGAAVRRALGLTGDILETRLPTAPALIQDVP